MYVDYKDYTAYATDPVSEDQYKKDAPFADAYIDNATMGRVGRAVRNGEDLPEAVKMAYSRIIAATEADGGERVSSFSNGVDSYTFDTSETEVGQAYRQAIDLLPVEWISGVIRHAC